MPSPEPPVRDDADRRLDGFAAALRRWAERPVPPPPAWTAPPRPRRSPAAGWRWAAAALAAGAVALALVLGPGRHTAAPEAAAPPAAAETGSVVVAQEDVLVLWLDDETPLYLHLAAVPEAATERNPPR